ncbi:MAG: magnesium-protoporphyrin IX monomethyl ester anaerobic oxidative cyclase [Gemmataceae bacterium]|nr:magnesium-protoporphyrin IX monomethyl ester anaerobic oxidative cyclase [Gemmataceae bacterium]
MRVLLLNPPHPAVSSRCHEGRMPPLGLLSVGGPLIDAGHEVRLIDAEFGPLSIQEIVSLTTSWAPDAVLLGHSGSTSAHPVIVQMARALKTAMPSAWIVYGGVYPTYHAQEIIAPHSQIDVIVRGEGEATAPLLLAAIQSGRPLRSIPGIAYREGGSPHLTPPAAPIQDLDACRVGWELIEDWERYQYWGAGRAAVVQFSRGCPHLCSCCGQRGFWTRWRHRDPRRVAAEIGWLHRTHGVRFVDLADENPTTSPRLWRTFLESLIAENVPVQLVATIRAGDIVHDADILHLYKKAGFSRILMGVETTDADTQARIRKGATTSTDREAVRLLRQHDILSQVAYVVGFEEQTDRDFLRGLSQLLAYDPDQINAMYVTPHRWTPFYRESARRRVVEPDQGRWDYRHQVLATSIPPWRVFLWVKLTEAILQLRPRALWRVLAHRDRGIRRALRWCYGVGRRAWLFEVRSFFSRRRTRPDNVTLAEFWGAPQDAEEEALAPRASVRVRLPEVGEPRLAPTKDTFRLGEGLRKHHSANS